MKKSELRQLITELITAQQLKSKIKLSTKKIGKFLDKFNNLMLGEGFKSSKLLQDKLDKLVVQCLLVDK